MVQNCKNCYYGGNVSQEVACCECWSMIYKLHFRANWMFDKPQAVILAGCIKQSLGEKNEN